MNTSGSLSKIPFEHLNTIFDAVFEGVMITDSSGIIRLINKTAQRLHMGGEIPAIGVPLSDCSPHDWVEVKRVLASGQAQTGRTLVLPEAEVLVNRLPLFSHEKVIGVVSTMQDISMFEGIVQQLAGYRLLHDELESILEQYGDAFVVVDRQGIVLRVNSAYERLAVLGRQSIIGRNVNQIRRDAAGVIPLVNEVLHKQIRGVSHVMQPDGGNLLVTATPAFNERGDLLMVLVRIQNLTQISLMQEQFIPRETAAPVSEGSEDDEEIQQICAASGIVVRSRAMNRVVRQALKVSQVESSVLLQGESGVGKSMLASLIHAHSPRKKHPFVVINCGAIPEALMESELFGYEKGAFTGAAPQGKIGLIEAADKGTVFFDEIGELKYPLQVKLLEVIEKKSFIRVGSTKRISVDIRIVAATNRDLEQDVEAGTFRKDLFYRLNVIPLRIPPLRERREDIQAMTLEILSQYNTRHKTEKTISPSVMRWLMHYPFSGNMRELVNIMEWMLVMGEGNTLGLYDLPASLQQELGIDTPAHAPEETGSPPLSETSQPVSSPPSTIKEKEEVSPESILPLKEAMRTLEEQYIRDAIRCCGTLQKAAQALDIHFSTLWRKMVQYGIQQGKN